MNDQTATISPNGSVEEARRQVESTRQQLQRTARALSDRLRTGGTEILETGKLALAEKIERCESTVRDTALTLAQRDQAAVADPLYSVAHQVNGVASYLETHTPKEIITDAAGAVRKHPLIAAGSAVALGLAVGRFFKASDPA